MLAYEEVDDDKFVLKIVLSILYVCVCLHLPICATLQHFIGIQGEDMDGGGRP